MTQQRRKEENMKNNPKLCERCLIAPASSRIKSDEMDIVVCTMCAILALNTPCSGSVGMMSVERIVPEQFKAEMLKGMEVEEMPVGNKT